jgi:biotin carboxyl carrier protein
MKLDLTIDGVPGQIEILLPPPACRFRLDGEERDADVETPEPGVYSVVMNGRVYDARIEVNAANADTAPNAHRVAVVIDGFRFPIDVRDPRRLTRLPGGQGRAGVQTVAAPMPGKVVRVLVAPGERVEAGQGLVVVEAMKMQNEMKASLAGRVATVPAKEGATVAAGEILATIE